MTLRVAGGVFKSVNLNLVGMIISVYTSVTYDTFLKSQTLRLYCDLIVLRKPEEPWRCSVSEV